MRKTKRESGLSLQPFRLQCRAFDGSLQPGGALVAFALLILNCCCGSPLFTPNPACASNFAPAVSRQESGSNATVKSDQNPLSDQNQSTDQDPLTDQAVDDSRLPTGRLVQPAGQLVSFNGRPVDLKLSHDGRWILAKDRSALRVIDTQTFEVVQTVNSPGGASLFGLAVAKNGDVLFTNASNGLHVYSPSVGEENGEGKPEPYQLARTIELPADSFPCGIKLSADQTTAYVCLSKKNSVAIVELVTGKLQREIKTGVAPFDLVVSENELLVSNIGGRFSEAGDLTAPSAKTETVVDKRGVASTGTVSLIDLKQATVTRQVNVGRHPSVLTDGLAAGSFIVCNTNDDSIALLDTASSPADVATDETDSNQVARTLNVKPKANIPFGSMPSAVATWADQSLVLVALAGNNCVAVGKLPAGDGEDLEILGLIPTAWYPVALELSETHLYVACTKGIGSRSITRPIEKGLNSHDHRGAITKVALADILDKAQLKTWTETSLTNARLDRVAPVVEAKLASGTDGSGETKVEPAPIPRQLGEPSHFKHVIYVIKENRTFDQVFGDVKEARSEPSLCIFPEKVTPNHHALAQRFGLLDNYYCNGVLSADGHSWATEGNVTPYLERAFGGFARSYTFGDDPITYSSSGFLWDHVLDAGLSFRNYGEFNYSEPPQGMKYQEVYEAYANKQPIKFSHNIGVERVKRYSCLEYPGWNMVIPDVLRMERFLAEFENYKTNGGLPSLCLLYLPQDHLGGGITSRSHMADNDLAIGQLVDAISHSQYWKDTVIFINEDDPQNGYDHVDGHRSLCLTVSAYSRPGVNSQFYNQTSVLRTILHIFGLPPMNQQDASAPLMTDCFQAQPNFEPYKLIPANFPLNESPEAKAKQSSVERKWRETLATVPIERTGMKTERDEDNLNRFVWHEMMGWETPYPAEWAGAHARGLPALNLRIDADADED